MLRRCFLASLRDVLGELPETLDGTYECILLGIEKEKREYVSRLFQCLAASIRPLRVEELAEVLAMRFESGNIPYYHVAWQLDDVREAILSACSSIVVVANVDGSQIVQFSHFSVKEFLTSDRLADASADLSRHHIDPVFAHAILAQASLSVLLHLDDSIDKKRMEDFPFAVYAAQHWVDHAQSKDVSKRIQDQMARLFDPDKPLFATRNWIYDIDYPFRVHMFTAHPTRLETVPLYYTLCGFRDLVEHLLVTHPGDINTVGGYHGTPLYAALAKGSKDIAALLIKHGADVDALDSDGLGALHIRQNVGAWITWNSYSNPMRT